MCLVMSKKSLERKLMPRALCHVIALTQLAKGMFAIACSFHSNLKTKLLYPMLPFMDALYWRRQCLPFCVLGGHKAKQTNAFSSFCSIFPKSLQHWRSLLIQCFSGTTEKLRIGLLHHKTQTTLHPTRWLFTGQEPWAPVRERTQGASEWRYFQCFNLRNK